MILQQKNEIKRLESKTFTFLIRKKIEQAKTQLGVLEKEQSSLQRTVNYAQEQIAAKKKENLLLTRRNQEITLNQPIIDKNIASLADRGEALQSLWQQAKERQIANARIEEWFLKQVVDDTQLERGMTWSRFVQAVNAIPDRRLRQEMIKGLYYQVDNNPQNVKLIQLPIDETMVTLFGASTESDGLYTSNELGHNQNKVSRKTIAMMANPRRLYREGSADISRNEVLKDPRVPADIKTAYLRFVQRKYPDPEWKSKY